MATDVEVVAIGYDWAHRWYRYFFQEEQGLLAAILQLA